MSEARKCTEDLRAKFVGHPTTQHLKKFSPSEAAGSIELGWYRGEQSGRFDAYKKLRRKFPEAANYLLKVYGMSAKDGSVS